jgi:hypothetical protein
VSQRKTEKQVQAEVLTALGREPGVLLLLNSVGVGVTNDVRFALQKALEPWGPVAQKAAAVALQRHHITYGLGVGSPDLVGCVDGRAVGLELKAPDGEVAPHQVKWHAAARRRGCFIASAVRSADDALAAIARCREGASE